jgi:hypothetical protein
MIGTRASVVAGLLLVAGLSTVPAQRDATIGDSDAKVSATSARGLAK